MWNFLCTHPRRHNMQSTRVLHDIFAIVAQGHSILTVQIYKIIYQFVHIVTYYNVLYDRYCLSIVTHTLARGFSVIAI